MATDVQTLTPWLARYTEPNAARHWLHRVHSLAGYSAATERTTSCGGRWDCWPAWTGR